MATPSRIMVNYKTEYDKLDDGLHYLFKMHRDKMCYFVTKSQVSLTSQKISDATTFMSSVSEVSLSRSLVAQMLDLFPFAKIKLAEHSIHETDVRDELADAVGYFFTGSWWPKNSDQDVDAAEFVALIQKQAQLMGYGDCD
jgi:hypothetical protein